MPRPNIQDKSSFNQKDDSVSSHFDPSVDARMDRLTYETGSVLEKANRALQSEEFQPGIRWTREKNAMIRQSIKELEPSQIDHFLERIEGIQAKNRSKQAQWNQSLEDLESRRPANQHTSTEISTPCHGAVKEPVKSEVSPSGRLEAPKRTSEQGVKSTAVKKPSAFTFFNTRGASSSTAAPRPCNN